ncbi:hypothetical protein AMS68_007548 [Peltaster fructicola]|uniref:Heterokaryon incompatibility domain-containing protein n=1 Tax=Peltaster fructicola TaxID=286661 RepID=A0A6H0Y535_9PEZI|nr:hypothetical protein AMS68_007548 [Peltaster fructicola]
MSRLTRWKSPQQSSDASTDFRYAPLISAKTGIRLARLQPGSGNKAIAIDLIDSYVTGTSRIEYDALSYVWGTSTRDKVIFCNGKRLQVTKTLVEALGRFRRRDAVVTLWIDQICICQDRVAERNAQVQMMGDIFRAARKVIVWLGDDYDDSKAGMQLAQQLLHIAKHRSICDLQAADLEVHGLPKQSSKRWKALAAILHRPWFWRTWIVQEVVLNPNVDLVLGASNISWDELGTIVTLLEGPLPRVFQLDQAITAFELPFTKINKIRMRHQGRMPESRPTSRRAVLDGVFFDEPEDVDDDMPDILDLLLMSRCLGATDPRDKIYGLLGIGKHSIETDYSLSSESLFNDFALSIIGEVTHLNERRAEQGLETSADDKEVRKAMILLSCAGRQNQTLDLPSWVPDWTMDIASRPLVFGIGHRFQTGGTRLGTFDWQPDSGLQLSGLLFDTVQTAGAVHLAHAGREASVQSHRLIEQWWTEAMEIAVTRVVRSPGSSMHLDAFANLRRSLGLCKHGYYIGDEHGRRQSLLDEAGLHADREHNALHTMTLGPTRGRVVIVTATGYMGLAPHGAQEGDLLFVVLGSDVPYLLRHKDDGYELIGEAYLQGIMHGEALEMDLAFGVQEIRVR